jgi:plasmid stability protein
MATLHVRNIPEKLYKRIQRLAEEENRSITAEVIQLLTQGLEVRESRRGAAAVMERIRRRSRAIKLPKDWTDAVELLREDRSR